MAQPCSRAVAIYRLAAIWNKRKVKNLFMHIDDRAHGDTYVVTDIIRHPK
jgi:hypothetical protein